MKLKSLATVFPISATFFSAQAAPITDPANDFLPTFVGPDNGDVLIANVLFNGSTFTFQSPENGAIGTTDAALFVWGVDRGTHVLSVGAPGRKLTLKTLLL